MHTCLTVKINVSSEATARAREAEEGQGHRNGQIDADLVHGMWLARRIGARVQINLSHVDVILELARAVTVACENGSAISVPRG